MNTRQDAGSLQKKLSAVNWKLLVFLVLVMNVKLIIKLAAIVIAVLMDPVIRREFNLKKPRLPLFYGIMIFITIADYILYRNFSTPHLAVTFAAVAGWLISLAAIDRLKLFTDQSSVETLHHTIYLFFLLNIAWSGINIVMILWEIGWKNPFLYQGEYQKYFINTGDYIKGLSFDTSTTNAVINSFGVVYFLFRNKYAMVLLCMITLLLTASNITNIILLTVFAGLLIMNTTRVQKSIMVACSVMTVIFFIKCSPQNEQYVSDTLAKFISPAKKILPAIKEIPIRERPHSLLTTETRKEKIAVLYLDSLEQEHIRQIYLTSHAGPPMHTFKPGIPGDSIHTASFQWKRDTTALQRRLIAYFGTNNAESFPRYQKTIPGKMLALTESIHFLKSNPEKIVSGDGAGNFSSKLAFRATGLKIAGAFPIQFTSCSPEFLHNHLSLYTYFFTKHADAHSAIHSPASVYDQLLTEYGLLGLVAFIVGYCWFFLQRINKRTYAVPLVVMMLAFFAMDYWFEQLSVVILFELLLFVNIKEYQLAAVQQ